MRLTRRGWIGGTAALSGALAGGGGAGSALARSAPAAVSDAPAGAFQIRRLGAGRDYTAALEALRAYARAELAAIGLPGMTLAVTDVEGFTAVLALGWADVDRKIPVDPGRYFQIGSISKSFIALTILALADQGRLEVDAPVARYLPDASLPAEPITVAQLLSHTAGLPDGAPLFPRTPDARLWCGLKPGSRFSYSNTGYELLGRIIERVTGQTHQAAVAELARGPLGLAGMAGTIAAARRGEFAVGYWPADATAAASLPGAGLEFASWSEEDTPAGSIGATSDQMAVYLRALIRFGRGQGQGVLSEAMARRFVAPVIDNDEFGPGAQYACGVAIVPVDGVSCLHHTGGMMSFSSSFHVDTAAGVGCFASVNARNEAYRPRLTTAYAVRLLRAVRAGAPLPAAPDPLKAYRFKDPTPFVGRFVGDGRDLIIEAGPDRVEIRAAGAAARVVPQGPDRLVTDHPALSAHGLDAVREGGVVVGYWWGETLFGRDGPRPGPVTPPALRALAGVYLNRDPWVGGAEILVRGDELVAEGIGRLVDRGGWWSAEKDTGGVERLRFEAVLNGKARRLNISGADMLRITV